MAVQSVDELAQEIDEALERGTVRTDKNDAKRDEPQQQDQPKRELTPFEKVIFAKDIDVKLSLADITLLSQALGLLAPFYMKQMASVLVDPAVKPEAKLETIRFVRQAVQQLGSLDKDLRAAGLPVAEKSKELRDEELKNDGDNPRRVQLDEVMPRFVV